MNIERIKRQALDYLLQHGSNPQAVHLFGTKGTSIVLLEDIPEETLPKQKALFLAGAKAAHAQNIGTLQSLFLVSEAWVSVTTTTDTTTSPSRDPERKEALVVYGIDTLSKEQRMILFELIRGRTISSERSNHCQGVRSYR